MTLASLDRRPEYVGVSPIVVAELEFRDIEREIFLAHLVECPDHTALNQRPKAFDGVRVNRADNIPAASMVTDGVREIAAQAPITRSAAWRAAQPLRLARYPVINLRLR
jgi:hypothetical protein